MRSNGTLAGDGTWRELHATWTLRKFPIVETTRTVANSVRSRSCPRLTSSLLLFMF